MKRIGTRELGIGVGVLLCFLAAWQFHWLGAGLFDPVNHGMNEDWDWQLTLYEVSRAALVEHGELPFWNPFTQGGVPLWANPEAPFLYPPFLLVLGLGTEAGLKIWILLHLWLLIWGGWLAGREIGLDSIGAHGAGLLSLCSLFIPGFIAVGHVMYLPLGWLPLAWVAARRGRWALGASALSLAYLGTGHHLLVYGAMWIAFDALLCSVRSSRLRWLGMVLAANGLLLGQAWAKWPILACFAVLLAWQRPAFSSRNLVHRLLPVVWIGGLTALLLACKLTTLPALFERAERLAPQVTLSIADPYTVQMAWDVLRGAGERLSGHEGQNVLLGWVPILLGWMGLLGLAWKKPAVGVLGLLWWNIGWGGSTPVNLLEFFHRLPGLDHIRVVERYSLIWTMFLGWGMGWVWTQSSGWGRGAARVVVGGMILTWVAGAAPQAAKAQRLGPGAALQVAPGSFVQARGEGTNYASVRANQGRLDCWTTAWLEDPAPGLRAVGDVGYRGEAWLAQSDVPVAVQRTNSTLTVELPVAGRVVFNQNAFRGWRVNGAPAESEDGLLAADLPEGESVLIYRPPGLGWGMFLSSLGLWVLGVAARRRVRARKASNTEPQSQKDLLHP
ncbi:MAG: hypothetical protein VX519_09210 [Myxococcota bacterium]|nr:hypothetical protein [Myxococcota bacterium]